MSMTVWACLYIITIPVCVIQMYVTQADKYNFPTSQW